MHFLPSIFSSSVLGRFPSNQSRALGHRLPSTLSFCVASAGRCGSHGVLSAIRAVIHVQWVDVHA